MLTETNEYGDEKYVVSLKGQYDGVQAEFLHLSERAQVIVELYDEGTRDLMESIKIDISYPKTKEKDKTIALGEADMVRHQTLYDEQTDDLIRLTAWWLAYGFVPKVKMEDWSVERGDENYKLAASWIKEKRTHKFLDGKRVKMLDGYTVQVDMFDVEDSTIDTDVIMKDSRGKDWAWIRAKMTGGVDEDVVVEISSWGSCFLPEDDLPALRDVLAFTKRYLMSFYKKIEITQDDLPVEIDDIETAERTYYWLGF